MKTKGFSIIEFLVAITIATVIIFVVTTFAKDIFSYSSSSQASMVAQLEGRKVLSSMVSELRATTQSALADYPINTAATSTVSFYADVNNDTIPDKVRYYLDTATKSLRRGVVVASGSPLGYSGAENISTLINDVSNGTSTAMFDYYDKNYAGTSTPMVYPIDVASIRLVKITVKIDRDTNRSPVSTTVSSQALFRNLKDNL